MDSYIRKIRYFHAIHSPASCTWYGSEEFPTDDNTMVVYIQSKKRLITCIVHGFKLTHLQIFSVDKKKKYSAEYIE